MNKYGIFWKIWGGLFNHKTFVVLTNHNPYNTKRFQQGLPKGVGGSSSTSCPHAGGHFTQYIGIH